MAGPGRAWRGEARPGKAGHGEARQGSYPFFKRKKLKINKNKQLTGKHYRRK